MRGRRCEEVILREIWLERTRLGTKLPRYGYYGYPDERRPVSISRTQWDGVHRSFVGSPALRGALRRLQDDIVDIFDLKKLGFCLV